MQNTKKRLTIWATIVVIILMIPLVAMQFTQEIRWNLLDFIIMGVVLFGIGLAYELIAKKSQKTVYRVAFVIGFLGAFLLFWVNGAVGIIGSEGQSANLLYGAVFMVGLVGSLVSRFQPKGMARTLFVAAIVQMMIPAIALFIWPPPETSWLPSIFGVFVLSGFFAILFILSALLFRRAK